MEILAEYLCIDLCIDLIAVIRILKSKLYQFIIYSYKKNGKYMKYYITYQYFSRRTNSWYFNKFWHADLLENVFRKAGFAWNID